MGVINVSRGSDHLRGLIRDSFRVVILGTFDGYPVGLICIQRAVGDVEVHVGIWQRHGGYCYSMGMRGKIRVRKRRCSYMRIT